LKLSERAQALLFVAVLLAALAGLWVAVKSTVPVCGPGPPVRATLQITGASLSAGPEARTTAGCTVYDLLSEWAEDRGATLVVREASEPLGAVFVLQIGGDANGDGGRYWQFWVNCAYATAGADLLPLHEGDRVHWRFVSEGWEGSPC